MNLTVKQDKQEYLKIPKLSASKIKLFKSDRMAFFNQVVLGKKTKDKKTDSLILGDLVDFCLTTCNGNFEQFEHVMDEKFAISTIKKGSGQLFLLADELFNITVEDMDESGNISTSFEDRFTRALAECQKQDKFKGKTIEKVLLDFKDSEAELYFAELMNNMDKIVVDTWMLEKAKNVVENVILDENVGAIFTEIDGLTDLGKVVIEFEWNGKECKCEIDKLIADNNYKTLVINELKTSWNPTNFEWNYLKLNYYLAAPFYKKAVEYWKEQHPEYADYTIKYQFIVIDTSPNSLKPIIKPLDDVDMERAMNGFSIRGYYYEGLKELFEEILWLEMTQEWKTSKLAYENNGCIPLQLNYD